MQSYTYSIATYERTPEIFERNPISCCVCVLGISVFIEWVRGGLVHSYPMCSLVFRGRKRLKLLSLINYLYKL